MEPSSDTVKTAEAIVAQAERLGISDGLCHGSVDAMKDFFEMSGANVTAVTSRTLGA